MSMVNLQFLLECMIWMVQASLNDKRQVQVFLHVLMCVYIYIVCDTLTVNYVLLTTVIWFGRLNKCWMHF